MSRRLPIVEAYAAANDAISRPCPTCSAPAGTFCSHPDGRLRRICCLARAVAPETDAPAVWTKSRGHVVHDFHDFSEPRRRPQEASP